METHALKTRMHILRRVNFYHFMTPAQITATCYNVKLGDKSAACGDMLKKMITGKLLHRPKKPFSNNHPYIYTLGTKGIKELKQNGEPVLLTRPPKNPSAFSMSLRHTLGVNECLISFELASRQYGLQLVDQRHERWLRADTRFTSVIPDGFVHFRDITKPLPKDYSLWLEYDTGSETDEEKFKVKIEGILWTVQYKHEEIFGLSPACCRVVFLTIGGIERRNKILLWIEEVLAHHGELKSWGGLFRVITLYPEAIDPLVIPRAIEPDIWVQEVWSAVDVYGKHRRARLFPLFSPALR